LFDFSTGTRKRLRLAASLIVSHASLLQTLSDKDASSMSDVPSTNEWLVAACGAVRKPGPFDKLDSFDNFLREEAQRCQWEKITKARDDIRSID
jgi:hypothetical protein